MRLIRPTTIIKIILLGSYNSGNHSSSPLHAAGEVVAAVANSTRKKKTKALRKAVAADLRDLTCSTINQRHCYS